MVFSDDTDILTLYYNIIAFLSWADRKILKQSGPIAQSGNVAQSGVTLPV